jgi:uncharacterized cupredoxin-like copper-binding protein
MTLVKIVAGCALTFALASPALAAKTTVHVKLWDHGGMMDMASNMQWGMGMHGNKNMAMMGIDLDKTSVPAGNVSFAVTNVSKDTIHEMLVAPIKSADATLPFIASENRVNEDASGDLGEVSELDPGKKGELTLDLKPGLYVLFCNVPGHFVAGMWTTIKVK